MTCETVPLEEYLDDELGAPARAEVDSHLAGCAGCRNGLEQLRSLEGLLRSVPAGRAPDADRFLARVRERSRRTAVWRIAGAAAAALVLVAFGAALWPSPDSSTPLEELVARYAQAPGEDLERRIRNRGPEALGALERMTDGSSPRIQFAAATLIFRLGDEPLRARVLARFQEAKHPPATWALGEPGTEDSDVEMVPVAISLGLQGQEQWAVDVLRRLHRLDREARRKIVDAVVLLLRSDNVKVQGLALEIIKELDIDFPLAAVVDLIDSPELGAEALRFLRRETGKDFGRDRDAWRKAVGSR